MFIGKYPANRVYATNLNDWTNFTPVLPLDRHTGQPLGQATANPQSSTNPGQPCTPCPSGKFDPMCYYHYGACEWQAVTKLPNWTFPIVLGMGGLLLLTMLMGGGGSPAPAPRRRRRVNNSIGIMPWLNE